MKLLIILVSHIHFFSPLWQIFIKNKGKKIIINENISHSTIFESGFKEIIKLNSDHNQALKYDITDSDLQIFLYSIQKHRNKFLSIYKV